MTFLLLFLEFFKIGLFTFGGGYAMIPLLKETVLTHSWLSEDEFLNMIGLSEFTPGPIAINMATYVGSTQGNLILGPFGAFLGSFLATLGVVLPAFIIMLIIAILLKKFIKNKYVQGLLKGIRPVAIALIFTTVITLGSQIFVSVNIVNDVKQIEILLKPVFIFFLIVIGAFLMRKSLNKKLNPIFVLILSMVVGIVVNYTL